VVDGIKKIIEAPVQWAFKRAGGELLIRHFVLPYFRETSAKLSLVAMATHSTIVGPGSLVTASYLFRNVFDHLAQRNSVAFFYDVASYAALGGVVALASSANWLIANRLELSWGNMSKETATRLWLSDENVNRVGGDGQGEVEQRIANDIKAGVASAVDLSTGLLWATSTTLSFSYVMYNQSPTLLGAAVAFSAGGTWIVHKLSKELEHLKNLEAATENDYRAAIQESRMSVESIAFYQGEAATRQALSGKLAAYTKVQKRRIWVNTIVNGARDMLNFMSFPFALGFLAPSYFRPHSETTIGAANQDIASFNNIRFSMDWYNRMQEKVKELKAITGRLERFLHDISIHHQDPSQLLPGYHADGPLSVSVKGLTLENPRGILCSSVDMELTAGDRVALIGPSGCGKTSLLRMLAKLSSYKKGHIQFTGVGRNPGEIMFIPQESYIPFGSIRDVLCFPRVDVRDGDERFTESHIRSVLNEVGFEEPLITQFFAEPRLEVKSMKLSGGEKQRLAIARALCHSPKMLVLDEATSAFEDKSGEDLYKLLFRKLPGSIIVSVAHRGEVIALHDRLGEFKEGKFTVKQNPVHSSGDTSPDAGARLQCRRWRRYVWHPHCCVQNISLRRSD
jgi:putative ATP-binding cassette transporter